MILFSIILSTVGVDRPDYPSMQQDIMRGRRMVGGSGGSVDPPKIMLGVMDPPNQV